MFEEFSARFPNGLMSRAQIRELFNAKTRGMKLVILIEIDGAVHAFQRWQDNGREFEEARPAMTAFCRTTFGNRRSIVHCTLLWYQVLPLHGSFNVALYEVQ